MIRQFFYLQQSDRRVVLTLLCVVVAALGAIWLAGGADSTPADDLALAAADSTADTTASAPHGRPAQYYRVEEHRAERFAFDPNTADSTQLLRLGLQPWQVRNIYKFRAAGGVYRRPQDFARLYGLTAGQYRELEPYIRISPDYQPATTLLRESSNRRDTTSHGPTKLAQNEQVVLNHADTTELRRVPGIGVYFANEIFRYGQRLGGYVSVDQLDEIDDFPPSAKTYFAIEAPQPQRLNLNRLTLNELKRHPYINFYQAKTICDYRRLHGPIHSLQDLSLSRDFPPEVIRRLEPYVEF